MRTRLLLSIIAAGLMGPAAPASAAEYSFRPVKVHGTLSTFAVKGVAADSVVRASLYSGGRRKTVALPAVRRALGQRKSLRLRTALRGARTAVQRLTLTAAPNTTITGGPVDGSTTLSQTARFTFSSNVRKARFECALDAAAWTLCSSGWTVSGLGSGSHTARVRAVDRTGIADLSPATRTWSVEAPVATTEPTAPTPEPAPAPSAAKATTRPVGSAVLTDEQASGRVRRSSWEPRPENATANQIVPNTLELAAFYAVPDANPFRKQVTGKFSGTTDEIIQWAAWKWGIDEDVMRAVAAKESWWKQSFHGDIGTGESWGLVQVQQTHLGTYPLSLASTAFNLDYYGAMMKYYYEGLGTWLNDPCCLSTTRYAAGDMWGAIGAWYSGRWHTDAANGYIADVKAYVAGRVWEKAGF